MKKKKKRRKPMADISKCTNQECPSHLNCYRYTAQAGMHQSYMEYKPKKGKDKCDDFICNRNRAVSKPKKNN